MSEIKSKSYWNKEDIFELDCPSCGASVEFLKTDRFMICPKCQIPIKNDDLDLGCAGRCPNASACNGLHNETKEEKW
jgi:endogenous inhibitor of DNA gyrase (YacG/DUF329 family)